jgi:hypothetical protein
MHTPDNHTRMVKRDSTWVRVERGLGVILKADMHAQGLLIGRSLVKGEGNG